MATLSPYTDHVKQQIVRQATAGTDQSTQCGKAPFAGKVTGVTITPAVAVAADGTNNRIFTLYNRGQAGAGTTVLATFTTATTAWVDNVDIAMTLTATVADRDVAQGDQFELVETHGGTGEAHGGAHLDIAIGRYI